MDSGNRGSGYLASFHVVMGPGFILSEKEGISTFCSLSFSVEVSQTQSNSALFSFS